MKICINLYHWNIETILSLYLSHTPEQRLYLQSVAFPAITRHAVSYRIITVCEWSSALLHCMCGWFCQFQHLIRHVQLIAAAVNIELALQVCSDRVRIQAVARFRVHFPQNWKQSLDICIAVWEGQQRSHHCYHQGKADDPQLVLVRYSIYRSIAILVNVRYRYFTVSRYFDISNIEWSDDTWAIFVRSGISSIDTSILQDRHDSWTVTHH